MIIKLIIIIIIILLLSLYFSEYIHLCDVLTFIINCIDLKINIKGIKNLDNFDNKRLIIMANHIAPYDYFIIVYVLLQLTKTNRKINTIATHKIYCIDNEGKNPFLNDIKKKLNKLLNFILYIKGNKESGEFVKKKILKKINKNEIILLFPEGNVTKTGISKEFKPGSFKLCVENSIDILPITIIYEKKIGLNSNEQNFNSRIQQFINLFGSNITLYIHEPIYDKKWDVLMDKVYNTIHKPFIKN
jgi:1-acyl-sn-glycerol-3-phosphate acyltransferase